MSKGKGTVSKVRVVKHPVSFDIYCNLRFSTFVKGNSKKNIYQRYPQNKMNKIKEYGYSIT
jgi:hypothetical protein